MDYLHTISDKDIFKNPEFATQISYTKRITVKAIVQNDTGEYAFVTNPIHGFYLLPGGGAEKGDLNEEIKRECVEEINYSVDVLERVGTIREYRNREAIEYETTCFFVRAVEHLEGDLRTPDEKKNGLTVAWFGKEKARSILENQVEKLRNGQVDFYNTAFNILRDYLFFKHFLGKEEK